MTIKQSPIFFSLNPSETQKVDVQFMQQPENSFNVVSPYEGDPFVGHLSTPITTSKLAKKYLSLLPIYSVELSPLLKGMNIGFTHGYFLFGPFAKLGPLRDNLGVNFIAFISTMGLIIILTGGLLIYGYVTFKKSSKSLIKAKSEDLLSFNGWRRFASGFMLGGLGGSGIASAIFSLNIRPF